MEVKLTGGTNNMNMGGVNPSELTPETYVYYCKLYLIERIAEVIPSTSITEYGDVCKLINCIDPILFKNLQLETNKLLLLNKIYSLFMEGTKEELSREFLYEKVCHIAKYNPELY